MKKPLQKICLDARLYGPTHTGIGRYVKNLVLALPQQPGFKNRRGQTLSAFKPRHQAGQQRSGAGG